MVPGDALRIDRWLVAAGILLADLPSAGSEDSTDSGAVAPDVEQVVDLDGDELVGEGGADGEDLAGDGDDSVAGHFAGQGGQRGGGGFLEDDLAGFASHGEAFGGGEHPDGLVEAGC